MVRPSKPGGHDSRAPARASGCAATRRFGRGRRRASLADPCSGHPCDDDTGIHRYCTLAEAVRTGEQPRASFGRKRSSHDSASRTAVDLVPRAHPAEPGLRPGSAGYITEVKHEDVFTPCDLRDDREMPNVAPARAGQLPATSARSDKRHRADASQSRNSGRSNQPSLADPHAHGTHPSTSS